MILQELHLISLSTEDPMIVS